MSPDYLTGSLPLAVAAPVRLTPTGRVSRAKVAEDPRPEKEIQAAVVDLIRQLGGQVQAIKAGKSKQAGQWVVHAVDGFADLEGSIHGKAFYFEMKSGRGRLEHDQWEFLESARLCGRYVAVVRSVPEARRHLDAIKAGLKAEPIPMPTHRRKLKRVRR
jgi:hypothetical protein